MRWRLFPKYATLIITLVGGMLVASGSISLYFSYRDNQQHLIALQHEKALAAATRIEQYIRNIEHELGWTALPQRVAGASTIDNRRFDYLKLLRQVPAITEVAWVDARGREQLKVSRLAMDVRGADIDRAKEPGFLEANAGKTWYSPVLFRKETEPYMTIARPAGSGEGVTIAEVNLKFVWDVVSRIKIGQAGLAFVIDSSGTLIAHPDIGLVLQKTDMTRLAQVAALGTASAADINSSAPAIRHNLKGTEVLTANAAIPTLDWTVFVEVPLAEALQPTYASLKLMGLLLLAGLAVSILASFFLARLMVRPIRALQEGAAQVGAGNLDQTITVTSGDELESLAQQFNQMAAHLKESHAELEQKVDARTRELSAALQQVQEKSLQLEIAGKHKSEFLANMSHELRTPLNAIIGFSEVMLERMFGEMNAKQEEYLRDIQSSGQHLLSLINDILDLAKVEAGRMELHLVACHLPTAIDNALALIRERAQRNDISLSAEIDPQLGEIKVDERKLKQILLNLLSNAVKFTPKGGSITVMARLTSEMAEIAVADTGLGIAPDDQAAVFEEFKQVGTDCARKAEGTGLGLALTRRFVELHGGGMRLQSAPGLGSTFTFTLPLSHSPAGLD